MGFGNTIQAADWKKEKHAPVIECPDTVQAGVEFEVQVSVGKEIPHPNTAEHHISWISLYFQPEGDKFVYQVGHVEFGGHGEAEVFTTPSASVTLKLNKPGVLRALSFCNLHGLWESEKAVVVA